MTTSVPANSSRSGATFLWVLTAFASFAVLFVIIQAVFAGKPEVDPRAPVRQANREKIAKAQAEITAKMGVNDAAKKDALFTKALAALQSKQREVPSTQVVPGSPTQLKQAAAAAAAAPAPAPAAAAPAPAAPAAAPAPATK